ncbi:MAG: RusA family crossover junction endodeoxyribonuclease [Ruminococcus sp.]|nr:RusA family crossover junction endodeoxyribonuclease [Ruminococcus sp.]
MFTINIIPTSKKNSQQILVNPKTHRPFIAPSSAYKAYRKAALMLIPKEARLNIEYPVNVKCTFYMPTRRRVDLTNLLEAADDVLVDAGVIADDNSGIVAAHDGSRVLYDKEHPRTEITITRL